MYNAALIDMTCDIKNKNKSKISAESDLVVSGGAIFATVLGKMLFLILLFVSFTS